jgi:short-subunit dehydrogenase
MVTNIPTTGRPLALITGASSGIGAVFARKLATRGYDLILVARRADRLRELAAELAGHTEILVADLATEEGAGAVEKAILESPRLEMLVNNAGFGTMGRFWEADPAGQERMHRVHVLATVRFTHAALAAMVPKGRGAVINVASVAAFAQSPGNVSYCATKAWMVSFTEGLDMELKGIASKVRVQALCPGYTLTEFHEVMGVDPKVIPGWLWIKVDDVVEASLVAIGTTGKVTVIPGWQYKLVAFLLQHLSYGAKNRLWRPGGKRV